MPMHQLKRGVVLDTIALQAHKKRGFVEDDQACMLWLNLALAHIEGAHDFNFLHFHGEIALAAGTQEYDFPQQGIRLDGDMLTYDNINQIPVFETPAEIDRKIGAKWKGTGATQGTPHFGTILNQKLWLGYTPNADFVARVPTLDCYYYQVIDPLGADNPAADLDDNDLLLAPHWMLPYIVRAALAWGLQEQDDNYFNTYMEQFEQRDLPKMRGFDLVVKSREPMGRPRIPRQRGRHGRYGNAYGSGQVR